jgi:hypothetical protein
VAKDKVISFGKYSQARQRAKERSRFIAGELRKAAADNGIPEEVMFSGGPDEEELTEIFFKNELTREQLLAEGILGK